MEQRLRRQVERNGRRSLFTGHAKRYPAERGHVVDEARSRAQHVFLLHGTHDFLPFHLRGVGHPVGKSLRRETVGIDMLDDIMHKGKVLHHQDGRSGQETQERNPLTAQRRQLGNDFHSVLCALRQLVLNLESADCVNLIAEEVDAERVFAGVGKDIENAATDGKLARLIHVIRLMKAIIAQRMGHLRDVDLHAAAQRQPAFVHEFLRHHQLCQGLRMGHNKPGRGCHGRRVVRQAAQHLGTQYLVGRIPLPVFHGTAVG